MNMSLLITGVKGILLPLFAIYLVNRWNFFSYFSFIPNDKIFDFGLASYICILECICHLIISKINDNKVKIECLLYSKNQKKSIKNIPNIEFNQDVAYVRGKITISGVTKRVCKNSIRLVFPNWVDVQSDGQNRLITIDDKVCIINIKDIINSTERYIEEATIDFNIGLIKNYCQDTECTQIINPSIEKQFGYEFIHNKFNLIGG